MTAASSSSASISPATFEIKSANLPLVALLLKSADLELKARFGDIPDFFENDPMVIDLSPMNAAAQAAGTEPAAIDFPALLGMLRAMRVAPIAVKGGSDSQMAAGIAAGLLPAPDARVAGNNPPTLSPASAISGPGKVAAPVQAPIIATAPLGAMVILKPVRSGQQIYARGRDLVVLAMVNTGAEIIADGHIHVYAPLRGKAMAGARGNTEARIFALSLEAELISIAGIYRTSENPLPAQVQGKPTQVRLEGEKLVMLALT